MQELFSDIDPHKKGYLTQQDWISAFGGFNWKTQTLHELKNIITTYFCDAASAFEYFVSFNRRSEDSEKRKVYFAEFYQGISALSKTRYKATVRSAEKVSEAQALWKRFAPGKESLD